MRNGDVIAEGYWLVADRQISGRGRQGRQWLDAPGNFMGSTAVRLQPHDPPPASLSFVIAIAVYETLLPLIPDPNALQLKWPNDLLLSRAKFCGLLLEREGDSIIIGVGINLAAAPEIDGRKVGALSDATPTPSRDLVAQRLAAQLEIEVRRWREFGVGPIMNRWRAAAHPVGTALRVHQPGGTAISGEFAGLEDDGALRLRLPDDAVHVIHAGDVMLEDGTDAAGS